MSNRYNLNSCSFSIVDITLSTQSIKISLKANKIFYTQHNCILFQLITNIIQFKITNNKDVRTLFEKYKLQDIRPALKKSNM